MTTKHNNFVTVISKEVALQHQTAVNLLKDAITDSISTSFSNEHLLRLSHLVKMIAVVRIVDQVMSSFGSLVFLLYAVKVYERPGSSTKNQQTFRC